MKTGTFKKITFYISKASGYGRYVINAVYKGRDISVRTNDSEIYDFIDNESDKAMYNWARRSCYVLVSMEYQRMKEREGLKLHI